MPVARQHKTPVALDPRYYPAQDLDVLPVPRKPIELRRDRAGRATVRLLVRIDASGRVTGVSVFESDAPREMDAAARQALLRTGFSAARKDGRAVRSEVVIELGTDSRR
jgi:TonB family protein